MARMWETPARTMEGRSARWNEAWAADSTLPTRLLNRVTIVRRLASSAAGPLVKRMEKFYAARRSGGEYLVNDPWDTLDLEPFGFTRWWSLPFMIRYPADARLRRSDLEIRECRSPDHFAEFVRTLVEGFGLGELEDAPTTRILDQRILTEPAVRCWIGVLDGRTIGTSVAVVADGVVGVYLVSVVPAMRGRGFGEELTWHATLADEAPATLQASAMGQPVYERMGYVIALQCATWIKSSRANTHLRHG